MLRLLFSAFSFFCLLTAALLLWQSHALPGHLPHGMEGWLAAWFDLFENPLTTAVVLAGAFFLAVASICAGEMLAGLLLSGFSALVSFLCLMGFMGSRFPAIAEHLQKWLV